MHIPSFYKSTKKKPGNDFNDFLFLFSRLQQAE